MAEEDSEVGKIAKTAGTCREIYSAITAAKGNRRWVSFGDVLGIIVNKSYYENFKNLNEDSVCAWFNVLPPYIK